MLCNSYMRQFRSSLPKFHCVKSVHIWSYSGPHFPALGQNKERYSVSLRFQSEYGKMRTRTTPNTNTFHTVFTQRPWSDYLQILCTDYYLTLFLRDWLLLCAFLFTVRFFFIVLNDFLTSALVVVRLKQTVDEQSKFT